MLKLSSLAFPTFFVATKRARYMHDPREGGQDQFWNMPKSTKKQIYFILIIACHLDGIAKVQNYHFFRQFASRSCDKIAIGPRQERDWTMTGQWNLVW